ncbi:MAG: hypothetical protein GVY24_03535 [Planctomycetes bacterium]|jgi:hypothetical protein|nr:hypothetical protein [Planctomycetota bacterium]
MAEIDPQLVAQITRAVIDALQRGGGEASADSTPDRPAPIKPAIGVCTGDYSQFTDRPDLGQPDSTTTPNAERHEASDPAASPPAPPALTGIITAQQLQDAIAAAPDGVATLAPDARLTPLANDHVRENPDCVRRVELRAEHAIAGTLNGAPWRWWAEGHCPTVAAAMQQLTGVAVPSGAPRSEAGLAQMIRDLSQSVRHKSSRGGLIFVRSAARAVVMANRCAPLRAIVGTCPDAVEQGLAQIGANVLIVEYPYINAERLAAMVNLMTRSRPAAPPYVERELADLHRHG